MRWLIEVLRPVSGPLVWAGPGWVRVGLRGGAVEGADSDEVVGRGLYLEPGPVSVLADERDLAATADGLDPAEWFLDPFSDPLGNVVTGVSGSAAING